MSSSRAIACAAVAAVAMGAGGCSGSVSVGDKKLEKGEIEKQLQPQFDALARKQGAKSYPKISCPKDIDAKKGATTRCTAKGRDGTLGINVRITKADDNGKVRLRFKADDAVTP